LLIRLHGQLATVKLHVIGVGRVDPSVPAIAVVTVAV
jgi:hypothetical protein